jgi:type I restriction enzyme S subunit
VAWKTIPLGDVLSQSRNHVQIEPGKQYKQITVRLWGKGLTLRGICDGSEIAAERQVVAQAGDFIISKIDARHGAFGLVPEKLDGALVSNDFPCFAINREILNPSFLKWFSKTDAFIGLCERSSAGSTNRVRLKEKFFLGLQIPLPSFDEQKAIARRLDGVEAQLQDRLRALQAIEHDSDAMLQNTFNKIVEGADYRPLGEVAPLVRRPVDVELDGEYPELGVRSFGKGPFHKPVLTGADVGNKRLFEIHQGDLLFNIVFAWEGAIAVPGAEDHGRVGSHRFLTCVPDPKVATSEFLRYYLLSPEGLKKVGKASPGGAGRNRTLGIKKAEQIMVPVPDIQYQHHFDDLLAHVEEIRAIRSSTTKAANALLPAMLHEIFERQPVSATAPAARDGTVVSLPMSRVADTVDTPFKESVLVAAIINTFYQDGGQPLGNFRLQKAVYFARRFMGESALDSEYLRKAAGPYNPAMRYSGGIKSALEKNWIAPATGKFGDGHTPGSAIAEAHSWIEKYRFGQPAAWVRDKFKFKHNDIWELLATIDYATLALDHRGQMATAQAVFNYIDSDPEWHQKIAKFGLTEPSIQNSMVELEGLFARRP